MGPPLAAGLIVSLVAASGSGIDEMRWLFVFPNALFYGCAIHAAGFFMPRGMKLFGWLIIAATGLALLFIVLVEPRASSRLDHAFMGALFGLLHVAYGIYLYITEARRKAA